jgi:GT2 family glycosyltransferase
MKLSVVIVNYNVEHFLEQCLKSVFKAMEGIEGEVFVVDNHSVDGSVEMVREKFPEAHLIANQQNTGFSKANNQAIELSKGQYVLLLNPDTVVEEDTFKTCVEFMDAHPDAGACGVKLIDGKGNYLPESKRGLPTPEVAFYKIFGFSSIFPKSKKFGKYHLGYLDPESTHVIEVLSGAFMFIRKDALDISGNLDEAFFMYGEDIDLSYRITKAGYKIFYHPQTRVIHYRGESTKKSSINYVFVFYQAMIIFAKKHFSPGNAQAFSFLINLAVYLRAGFSILKRIASSAWLPILDTSLFFGGMFILKTYWAQKSGIYYPYSFMWIAVPLYIIAWISSMWVNGSYEKPLRSGSAVRGVLTGTVIILLVYALLPETYRYSRFLTLVGAAWAALSASGIRTVINLISYKTIFPERRELKRILLVGCMEEASRIKALINQSPVKTAYIGIVNPLDQETVPKGFAGNIGRLKEMVEIFGINELIFCGKDLSSSEIMNQMMRINHPELEYKIAPPESLFIIGSNSIQTSGELYVIGLNSIDRPLNRRKKRALDIFFSLFLLVFFPLLFVTKSPIQSFVNAIKCLVGKFTWVGYSSSKGSEALPKLRKGIFNPLDPFCKLGFDELTEIQTNILYAKDYRVSNDLSIIYQSFRSIGRKISM